MKIKWQHLYILWNVLSLGLLVCGADTYKFTRRKKLFKQGVSKSKPIRQSTTGDRKLSQNLPADISGLSPLSPQRLQAPTPPSVRQRKADAKIQSDFVYLPDVSVTCSISEIVVRVKAHFYGLGADAEELKLGSSCESNGILRPYGDLLFTYPLTACDAMRELPHGYIVYKFVLHYEPSQKRFPSRAHPIDVQLECRYQRFYSSLSYFQYLVSEGPTLTTSQHLSRNHHVYQLAVKPTWQTPVLRKRLKGRPNEFHIDLMDDLWSAPSESRVYQLGNTVNFQVSARHLFSGGKLYISSCYAESSNGVNPSLKYTIIDNLGCMVDSKSDPGASQFVSRTDNSLRFSLKAFQFTADPDTEISIHCKLSVTSEDQGPAHKSCTYRENSWTALTGDDSICECCDSQCVTSKPRRAVTEGSASSRSLFVADQPYTAEDVLMRREYDIIINNYNEMHSHENLWKSTHAGKYDDEEERGYMDELIRENRSRTSLGVMAGPDFDKFRDGLMVKEQKASEVSANQFGEDVLEIEGGEDGSKGREAEISDAGVIQLNRSFKQQVSQSEHLKASHLPDSKTEEENIKYTVRGEEDERTSEVEWKNDDLAGVADDREMTWYFTWR